jgi:hypothetical protein
MEDTGWQYSGNLWKMIDNIQWAFVMEKMLKENDPRLDDAIPIISSPHMIIIIDDRDEGQ